MPGDSQTTTLLIGGESVAGTGEALAVENPYTTESIVEVAAASPEQIDAAVAAAREAWPGWARMPAGERCELLHEVARRLRAEAEELARTMTAEGGKPLIENRDELEWTAAAFDYYAEIGRDHAGRVIPPIEATQLAMVVKDPLGVVGCIVPWNYPLLLLAWKVAPALAAGNCVVCKPSELTPLSTLMLAPAFAHLPAGVVNLVAGAGEVGAAIASHPGVDCVAFTGSVATGKKVAEACVPRMARMNLEMGGKDAFIVCADVAAEIEVAARGGAWAAFLNAGQVCTSAERFYVEESVFDDYVAAFVEHTRGLVLGDPFEVATDIGPMVSDPQRAKVVAQLEAASAAGAEVLTGGDRGGQERGHFLSPAVVTGAAADSALLREETFGPVAPLVRVSSLDEAIAEANSTEFGLGANVYTANLENAVRCMRELRAGTVWINDPLTDNDAGPFGGFKQSGLGRELGREGLEAFQETKHVHMESKIERKEWWYPYREYGAE
ncbi:MAG TPA: aldehyde dehydrogenase family protein [Solirubrobacterales bacterium]|nr:aldehyde dehydrogenase family protein [Solirubrobacterales bacterium]